MGEDSSGRKNRVDVIYSPELFSKYFEHKDCVVVVIDIFRATSAICAAFDKGLKELIPVLTLDEAISYKEKGFLAGAERNGEVVKGFDFGNSPLQFHDRDLTGKSLVLTTTNGTRAIDVAKEVKHLVVGAFTNISAICSYIENMDKDVLLLCAGWKGRFNLEDTLFAGAVAQRICNNLRFTNLSDATIAAIHMYNAAKNDLYGFLGESSHRKRLSRLNMEEDIIYCLTEDLTSIVPILKDDRLVAHRIKTPETELSF